MAEDKSTYEEFIERYPKQRRLLQQEELLLHVTEAFWQEMGRRRVSRSELATRMIRSKPLVTQLLSGDRNLTLRTVSDLAFALGMRPVFRLSDQQEPLCNLDPVIITASWAEGCPFTQQTTITGQPAENNEEEIIAA